jgi:hypothetical protein
MPSIAILPSVSSRWRNWQTRTLEGCVPQGVEVRVLSGTLENGLVFLTGRFSFASKYQPAVNLLITKRARRKAGAKSG